MRAMFSDRTNWEFRQNRLAAELAHQRAVGRRVIDLTASNPTLCGFAYDADLILRALTNRDALKYEPDAKGLQVARGAVAAYYSEVGTGVNVPDVVLCSSTSEAYSFSFRALCNPGDEILVPAPSYPLFDFLAEIEDVRLERYALVYDHGWQIDFHALEEAITSRTRGVIVVNPNNPTGQFAKPTEIARLNELCNARSLAMIADEVFLDFRLAEGPRSRHASSLAANAGALTLAMSGLSKICGLPQMKLAWLTIAGPEPLKSQALARLEVIGDTYLSPSTPVQLAAPELLEHRGAFQQQVMTRMQWNLKELDRQLALQKVCSRLLVEGGWYVVLRVPAVQADEQVAIDLLAQSGVYVHPGHFFDFPRDGFVVMSLITSESDFREGVRRLLAMFT
jgi:alanine-synthesizing transaminase